MSIARTEISPHDQSFGPRVPPHNLEAEQSVLGAIMLSKDAMSEVLEVLQPDDFYRGAHQSIARAAFSLYASGEAVDAITVVEELRRQGTLETVGGAPYIHTLLAGVPTAANASFYSQIVVENATLRRLIDAATRIAQECYDIPADIDSAINRAGEMIYSVASRRIHSDFRPIRELLAESMEQLEMLASRESDITGVPTGFRDIDAVLSGLQKQNLIVVAARPAMGKTSFVLNVAHNVALKAGVPVVIFSLEMSQVELVSRLICAEAHVDSTKLRTGHLNESDWTRVSNAVGKLDTAPLYIDDTAATSMMEIRAKCQRLKRQQDLGLVVVDYIQLMQGSRRSENRVQEVSEISRGLKILAKEMDVPVVAVSQLSRQPEQGGSDKRPQLSHLRECVTGDTLVCLADGSRVPIQELVGTQPQVFSLDSQGKIGISQSDMVWSVGRRPVYRVRLASGMEIRATAEHRLLGASSWVRIADLQPGTRLATARHLQVSGVQHAIRHQGISTLGGYAQSDLFWDVVRAVEFAGEEDVYDLTVPGPACWVADGIVSHNSGAIEQDSDVVMFVYRDEYYNHDTEAKGEAEIIIAKHRNGPVGTERLAFLGQYTKFADLARQ